MLTHIKLIINDMAKNQLYVVDRYTYIWDELSALLISNDGRYELVSNKFTHRHCLFIEVEGFNRTFVFPNRHDILKILGSTDFQYLIAQFDDAEYLINIEPRNNNDEDKDGTEQFDIAG